MKWFRSIFIALIVLVILQILFYYPQMPDVVASHFDGSGTPNDWIGKTSFFVIYGFIMILLVIIFLYIPHRSEKRPNLRMKLPNRDYWLAPEQRTQTLAFFKRQMMIIGIVHLTLALIIVQFVIDTNFNQPPMLFSGIFWALLAYFVYLLAWIINFFLRFRKPA